MSPYISFFAEGYRTRTSGWQGAPLFQEIRPGAGFKTGDFVKEKLGVLPQNHSNTVQINPGAVALGLVQNTPSPKKEKPSLGPYFLFMFNYYSAKKSHPACFTRGCYAFISVLWVRRAGRAQQSGSGHEWLTQLCHRRHHHSSTKGTVL